MTGKYFIIISQMNELVVSVMTVHGEAASAGARVVMAHRKAAGDNAEQQWWVDITTNTIRSRLGDFCLDTDGGKFVINPINMGNTQQKWDLDEKKGVIHSKSNPNVVMDIVESNTNPGAALCAYQFTGNKNQLWHFEFQKPEFFYIVSEMHDKVLEVEGGKNAPGTRVCMNHITGAIHQQWFESREGLMSRLNNLPLTTASAVSNCSPMMVKPIPDQSKPLSNFWVFSGCKIVNCGDTKYVCDIKQSNKSDGAAVIAFNYNGTSNQHWKYIRA